MCMYMHTYIYLYIHTYEHYIYSYFIHQNLLNRPLLGIVAHTTLGPSRTHLNPLPLLAHAHTHTYVHAYVHTYIHTYIHTCIHTYIHTYIRTHNTYTHSLSHTHTHTCTCIRHNAAPYLLPAEALGTSTTRIPIKTRKGTGGNSQKSAHYQINYIK